MASANPGPQNPIEDASEKKTASASSAEGVLFAEHLVEYVLQKLEHNWVNAKRVCKPPDHVKERFIGFVGEAVFNIITLHVDEIVDAFKSLTSREIIGKVQFMDQLGKTVTRYLESGYSHQDFLILAASFVGVAAIFLEKGNRAMADASAKVLSYVLHIYISEGTFNESGGWYELYDLSHIINNGMGEPETFKIPTLNEDLLSV